MKKIILLAVMIILMQLGCFAQGNLEKLSDAGYNVIYPQGMQIQAKAVITLAKAQFQPAVDIRKQSVAVLSDVDSISKQITDLLGAEEKQYQIKNRLTDYSRNSRAILRCLTNIKLIKFKDAQAEVTTDLGAIQLVYDAKEKDFHIAMKTYKIDEETLNKSYFPIIINSDGTIRSKDKLAGVVEDIAGSSQALIIAPVHETIAYTIAEDLRIYYPFTRWFNEGTSAWVAKKVITKHAPQYLKILDAMFVINPRSKQLRDKINLWAWPQSAFQIKNKPYLDMEIESAQFQYSAELVSNMLGKNGEQILPGIISTIKYNVNADSDVICKALTKAVGKDCKAMLLNYVPKDIKIGIETNAAQKLLLAAEESAKAKNYAVAEEGVRKVLKMKPDNINARLNLAWIDRLRKEKTDSEMQIFIAARVLKEGSNPGHIFEAGIESNYVLAKLSILLGNISDAKALLAPILSADPNHEDAKNAMTQIKALEQKMQPANSTKTN